MPRPPGAPRPLVSAPHPGSRRPLAGLLAILAVLIIVTLAGPFRSATTASAPFGVPASAAAGAVRVPAPSPVTPRVVGLPVSDAGATLIAAGFRSPVSWRSDPSAAGAPCAVVGQEPAAGATFQPGAPATLVIVRGRCR